MEFCVEEGEEGRLDIFLSQKLSSSRSQIVPLVAKEAIRLNGVAVKKAGIKLKKGDYLSVSIPEYIPTEILYTPTFDIPILYEDEFLLVISKPAGVVVHGAPSVKEATLVDWLKKRGVSLSTLGGEERHGIVHRLDKETSGALVIAKNNDVHAFLSEQLKSKTMGRYYMAVIDCPLKESTFVDKPIGRNPHNRLKMGIVANGRKSRTYFHKTILSKDGKKELIMAKLFTGRTHQIRVHLATLGRHILGDNLYGFKGECGTMKRHLLHAYLLYFTHPVTGERVEVCAPIPNDFTNPIESDFDKKDFDETLLYNHGTSLSGVI